MKKMYALFVCLYFAAGIANAQSKVFKEVSDEISSSMQPIMQDGGLVGYLAFTQLEKVSEDSFSYKLSIMDENLNDLGTVNFREEFMRLEAVAFEQDILCVAYFKSNIIGKQFKTRKAFNEVNDAKKNNVVLQFLNLTGKVIKTNSFPVDVSVSAYGSYGQKLLASGGLRYDLQLTNIPQKGFACYYGDGTTSPLILFDTQGERLWKKNLANDKFNLMLTTVDEIYILSAVSKNLAENGYEINSFGIPDSAAHLVGFKLEDNDGNTLYVHSFANDPVSGRPFIAGTILNKKYKNIFYTAKALCRGGYKGVYTIDFTGQTKNDVKAVYSYWSDKSKEPEISKKGKFEANGKYLNIERCIRDFNGNTYFAGSAITKVPRWGGIVCSVLLFPVGTLMLGAIGTHKYKAKDAAIIQLDKKGTLSFENPIDCNNSKFIQGNMPISYADSKKFFQVSNNETKANYVIVDDIKDIVIYNINQKKTARTISHKEGGAIINIYPAKEGHVMVSEYNKKEKYTRLSIEAL